MRDRIRRYGGGGDQKGGGGLRRLSDTGDIFGGSDPLIRIDDFRRGQRKEKQTSTRRVRKGLYDNKDKGLFCTLSSYVQS